MQKVYGKTETAILNLLAEAQKPLLQDEIAQHITHTLGVHYIEPMENLRRSGEIEPRPDRQREWQLSALGREWARDNPRQKAEPKEKAEPKKK